MEDLKTTLRLPAGLAADVNAYAASLGISINALCAVALADYLNTRPAPATGATGGAVTATSKVQDSKARTKPVATAKAPVYERPPGGVNAPCPCGSGRKWKHCHGKAA